MSEIKDLLQSSEENERREGLLFFPKDPSPENLAIVAGLSETDDSIEIRFLARKCLHQFKKKRGILDVAEKFKNVTPERISQCFSGSEEEIFRIIDYLAKNQVVQALPVLLDQLGLANDSKIVASLLVAIGKLGSEPEIRNIVPFLENESPRVRANAIEALELLGTVKAYPFILSCLKDSDNRVKANAMKAIRVLSPLSTMRLIRQMISSNYLSMQASAAYALAFFPSEENIGLLTKLLDIADDTVKENAARTLYIYHKRGIPQALEILDRSQPELVAKIKKMEGVLESIESVPKKSALTVDLQNQDPKIRISAIQKAVQTGDQSIARNLLAQLKQEKDRHVLATIILAFGRLQIQSAAPLLLKVLESSDNRCRANAIEALRLLNNQENFPLLIPFLSDSNNRVRANSVVALKDLPDADVVSPLKEMLDSPIEMVQKSAIYAITEIKTEATYRLLGNALSSSFPEVSALAQKCLEEISEKGIKISHKPAKETPEPRKVQEKPVEIFSKLLNDPQYSNWQFMTVEKLGLMVPPFWFAKSLKPSIIFLPENSSDIRLPKSKRVVFPTSLLITLGTTTNKNIDPQVVLNKRKEEYPQFFDGFKEHATGFHYDSKESSFLFLFFDHSLEDLLFSTASLAVIEGENLFCLDFTFRQTDREANFPLLEKTIKSLALGTTHIGSSFNEGSFCSSNSEKHLQSPLKIPFSGVDESPKLKVFEEKGIFGYKDEKNFIVLPPQFDEASDFCCGLARVQRDGKCFYISHQGNSVFNPTFSRSNPFLESLALIKIGDEWGYIDLNGNVVVKPLFPQISLMLFLFDAEMNWQISSLAKAQG